MSDAEERISADNARQGVRGHNVINVLAASLFLAGLAAIIMVVFFN